MAEAVQSRQEAEWDRTADILATLINCAAKKHVTSGKKLNPYRNRLRREPPTLDDMMEFL